MSQNSKNSKRTLLVTGIIILVFIVSLIALRKDASAPYSQVLVEDEFSSEIAVDGEQLGVEMNFAETIATVPSFGDIDGSKKKYQDSVHGFAVEVLFNQNIVSDYRETVTYFPFYPEERFEGRVLLEDVHMYVIDREYMDFLSVFSYGLLIPFISESQVVVTPRTTGAGENFLHQSFIDLRNGKTLLLTHKTDSEVYSSVLNDLNNSITIQ